MPTMNDSNLMRDATSDPVVRDAMLAMLDLARSGDLPGPAQFMDMLDESVLAIRAAHLLRFVSQSEAGKTLLYWLPEGNRDAMGLRDFLVCAGWLLTDQSGRLVLLDKVIGSRRYAAVLFVRTTRQQGGDGARKSGFTGTT